MVEGVSAVGREFPDHNILSFVKVKYATENTDSTNWHLFKLLARGPVPTFTGFLSNIKIAFMCNIV